MIIVDNSIVSFVKQINSGIFVASYFGKSNDTVLKGTKELLIKLALCHNIAEVLEKEVGLNGLYEKYVHELN